MKIYTYCVECRDVVVNAFRVFGFAEDSAHAYARHCFPDAQRIRLVSVEAY